jgi:hypothetical protein
VYGTQYSKIIYVNVQKPEKSCSAFSTIFRTAISPVVTILSLFSHREKRHLHDSRLRKKEKGFSSWHWLPAVLAGGVELEPYEEIRRRSAA